MKCKVMIIRSITYTIDFKKLEDNKYLLLMEQIANDLRFSLRIAYDKYKKENMLNGYDDIDYLMNIKDSIIEFAKNTPL